MFAKDCMLGGQLNHGWQPLLSLRLYDGSDLRTYLYMRGLGPVVVSVVGPTGVKLLGFFCSGIQLYVQSPYFCFISCIKLDLYVLTCRDDTSIS